MSLLVLLLLAAVFTSSLSVPTPSLSEFNDQQLAELSREQLLQLVLHSRQENIKKNSSPIGSIQTTMAEMDRIRSVSVEQGQATHSPQNSGLNRTIQIVHNVAYNCCESGNESCPARPMSSVAELQTLLDNNPNTVFDIKESHFEINSTNPLSIFLRSDRSLLMDSVTTISSQVSVPGTNTWGGALLIIKGSNIAVSGGRFLQLNEDIQPDCPYVRCNFAIDIQHSHGVKLRDGFIQGNFGNAYIFIRGDHDVPGYNPPVETDWVTFRGMAGDPNLITNMTLLHWGNTTVKKFGHRGIWSTTNQNMIVTRLNITGPFVFGIDLDGSSSGNIVASNYMENNTYGGVITEYGATHNLIVNNHVRGDGNGGNIYINGHLNYAVDNTVMAADGKTPNKIRVSGAMAIHNVSAISNRVVANRAGEIAFVGVGCGNYVSENRSPLPGGGWAYAAVTGELTGLGPGCIAETPNVTDLVSDISYANLGS